MTTPRSATLALTRGPDDWTENPLPSTYFAGIELDEFAWARQRSRRMTLIWFAIVLLITVGVAAAAWNLGTNLDSLIRP